ncbi:MAG: 3-alpha-hydroxysteroid dehydrogenase [Acidimicrobiales bacterium]|nr:MAG: 3-alpha-hydroxysteroid dehydrogenase [Acidimicrobiales bacterium]
MSSLFGYEGKKVVLTGGTTGVGAAAVERIAELGCTDLTVLDIKEPTGPATRFIPTDMSDPTSIDAAVEAIGTGVDVLFNNAGVAGVHATDFVIRVNYLGVRRLTLGLVPGMPRGGAIVNTASIAGQGWPDNLAKILELIAIEDWDESLAWLAENDELVSADAYGFSKQIAQVWTMYSSVHTASAHGVRTNSVCPGPIDTPLMDDFIKTMTEQVIQWTVEQSGGTMLTADDIARAVVMLGTDASVAMNGHNMIADHGFSASMTTGQVDFSGLG